MNCTCRRLDTPWIIGSAPRLELISVCIQSSEKSPLEVPLETSRFAYVDQFALGTPFGVAGSHD